MSYSFNQRKKAIRRFKEKYGATRLPEVTPKWYKEFKEYVYKLVRAKEGPPIASLQNLRDRGLI